VDAWGATAMRELQDLVTKQSANMSILEQRLEIFQRNTALQLNRAPIPAPPVLGNSGSAEGVSPAAHSLEFAHLQQQLRDTEERLASYTQNVLGGAAGADQNLQTVFQDIFSQSKWGDTESRSGFGSSIEKTSAIRACLGNWIEKYKVQVVLDIPCGDGNWQRLVPHLEQVQYYGFDISPGTVASAKLKNIGRQNMHFGVFDLVTNRAPFKADMIMVKEVIQHLPLHMGKKMLQNAKAAGIPWLAVTHNPRYTNREIQPGAWFPGPNLNAPPFNFGPAAEHCGNLGMTTAEHDFFLFDLREWKGQ